MAGLLLVFMAGGLAWGAQELVRSDALQEWERKRIPSDSVWKHALGSLGFSPATDLGLFRKATRKLPSMIDQEGRVWATPDANWVVVFRSDKSSDESGAAGQPQSVYCKNCQELPERWEPLGLGWTGFDLAIKKAERLKSAVSAKTARKIAKFRDPREIQY